MSFSTSWLHPFGCPLVKGTKIKTRQNGNKKFSASIIHAGPLVPHLIGHGAIMIARLNGDSWIWMWPFVSVCVLAGRKLHSPIPKKSWSRETAPTFSFSKALFSFSIRLFAKIVSSPRRCNGRFGLGFVYSSLCCLLWFELVRISSEWPQCVSFFLFSSPPSCFSPFKLFRHRVRYDECTHCRRSPISFSVSALKLSVVK